MDSCAGPEYNWRRPVGAEPGQVSLSHFLMLRSASWGLSQGVHHVQL